MGFLWKLEFQKRGTPHFHLLLFDPTTPSIKELRSLVKEHWYKIVGMRSRVSTSWNRHPSGEKYQAERILSGYVSTKGCERTNGHIERQNMGRKRLKEYAVY